VLDEHPVLAVDGHEEFGLGQGEHHFQLLLAGVARDVQVRMTVIDVLGALVEKLEKLNK
jgi:hypothetical protein